MRPAAMFVNCVYPMKITQKFRQLGVPLIVIFLRTAREPAHNNGVAFCHKDVRGP